MSRSRIAPGPLSKSERLTFLFRDSILYGAASAVSRLASLITLPILARHLSVGDYGVLDLLQTIAGFLSIMFVFGQETAVARYYYEYEDEYSRRQVISQSLTFQLLGLVVLLPPMWIFAKDVGGLLGASDASPQLLRIALLQIPFLVLINFSVSVLRVTFSRAAFIVVTLGYSALQGVLWIAAIIIVDTDLFGILVASTLASATFGLVGLLLTRRWLAVPRGFAFLREMLPFALPYGVICGLESFAPILERTLTKGLLGTEALGHYAAGAKVAMLVALVVYSFQVAWMPFALALHKRPDSAETYSSVLRIFTILACLLSLIVAAIAEPLVVVLASAKFATGAVVVFPLAFAIAVSAIGWIAEIGINISKRSHLKLYGYVIGLAATAAFVWLLAPRFGLVGVAAGVLLGNASRTAAVSVFSQMAHPLPWRFAPVALLVLLTAGAGMLGVLALSAWGPAAAAAVNLAAGLAVAAIGAATLISAEERRAVASLLRRYSSELRSPA